MTVDVLREEDFNNEEINIKNPSDSINKIIKEHNTFKKNDLVIHTEYGLGKFIGLESIEINDTKNDLIRIEYRNNAYLLVPVENCDSITKYSDYNESIKLDSLNSKNWSEKKTKIKKQLKNIARQLIETAKIRKLKQAQVFTVNEGEYIEFCKDFPFEPTIDQLKATEEILKDLSSGFVMDRLLCGDVGYGKTEVAIRAAFVVVNNKYKAQVALIAPTTLLCKQHYEKFIERFKNTDINIKSLSRYNSTKEIKEIKNGLADGSIDIVIGTQSLLGKNIKFKNLGLVIIDEEQRFGVNQKEKLKSLKINTHLLSLSATPIPRTLQMSMYGIKDMSLLITPPMNRNNINTIVCEYEDNIIKEAIEAEISNNGRVFFVVPRITDIKEVEARLKLSMPDLKYCIVHGKMDNESCEDIMDKFYNGIYKVLISTTIVENGIDIPTANTIIIYKANDFGLAQLYQLRGRVGRNNNHSYAYLTTKKTDVISDTAKKRLEIIGSIDSLGAGFMISSNDMEIRGAGNILGEAQTGHMREIGIELYNQMLNDAIKSSKNDATDFIEEYDFSPEIKFGISTIIPSEYIQNINMKIKYYRRIANVSSMEEIDIIKKELETGYGTLPESLENLLKISWIKIQCKKFNIVKISVFNKNILINFYRNVCENSDKLIDYVVSHPSIFKFINDGIIFFTNSKKNIFENVEDLFEILSNIICK